MERACELRAGLDQPGSACGRAQDLTLKRPFGSRRSQLTGDQVIFLDILDHEINHLDDNLLISDEAHRIVKRHPILGRVLMIGAGANVTLRLAEVVPERYALMARRFWVRLLRM